MRNSLRLFAFVTSFLSINFLFASSAFAAAPDGMGPWADSVLSSSQGLMKNGSPVPVIRSDPTSALGVAENDTTEGNFYSLGFGGVLALGFDNGISTGVIVVEATNPGYPGEKAKVEVSEDGTTWVEAGMVTQDGEVAKPGSISCAKYVRLTDISSPDDFSDETADGFDVDGVSASGEPCEPDKPKGGKDQCESSSDIKVSIKNKANVKTKTTSKAVTGKNKQKKNDDDNSIVTGKAQANATSTVVANTNVVYISN